MKYLKTYEEFNIPTEKDLIDYDIRVGDYVIGNESFKRDSINPYFIEDLVSNNIGEVISIFWSNKGYRTESIYCDVLYKDVPEKISKHISGNPQNIKESNPIKFLRKVTPEEYKNWLINKNVNKYNL